jgi:phosphate-selective porin OprO and OprP
MKKRIARYSRAKQNGLCAFSRKNKPGVSKTLHASILLKTDAYERTRSDERAARHKRNAAISLRLACALLFLTPLMASAAQDTEERIRKLEQDVEKLKSEQQTSDFRVFWKEGLRFETPDKDFALKLGGRIMVDGTWVSEDDGIKTMIGEQEDGVEFRRARMYMEGLIYGNVQYKLQLDFAGGDADLKDAFVALPDFPFGRLKLGHFKEPFGLEELTSSKYITFLERVLSSADPARNTGIMLHDSICDEHMTWAAGVFRTTDDNGMLEDDDGTAVTGRVTGLPVYEDSGASLVHLGVAYSHRDAAHNLLRLRSRPEAHMVDYFMNTGFMPSDDADLVDLEFAWVCGPFSLQAEYFFIDINRRGGASPVDFDGYYGQASYFLTGEHRRYKKSAGAFTRIKPKRNYGHGGGMGAWEVAARYSDIELNDRDITGGAVDNTTLGLNWYLNPNTRIMWNYIHSDKHRVGNADIFLMRAQIDF